MSMRPYMIEVCMAFAAGVCVGAWLENRKTAPALMERRVVADISQQEPEAAVDESKDFVSEKKDDSKSGVFVTMEDGKIVIDPSKRKRRRFFG